MLEVCLWILVGSKKIHLVILKDAFVIYSLQKYNTLYKDGEPLDDVEDWEAGIDDFFEWLQDEFPNGAILVAHNGFNCDAKQIVRDFQFAGYSDEQIEDAVAVKEPIDNGDLSQ